MISPVTEATEWCSGIVIAQNEMENSDCVDITALNKAVKREVHPLATVDQNLAMNKESKVFSNFMLIPVFGKFHLTILHIYLLVPCF